MGFLICKMRLPTWETLQGSKTSGISIAIKKRKLKVMISIKTLGEFLLGVEPDFRSAYEELCMDRPEHLVGYAETAEFCRFVVERLSSGIYERAKSVFDAIEYLYEP